MQVLSSTALNREKKVAYTLPYGSTLVDDWSAGSGFVCACEGLSVVCVRVSNCVGQRKGSG